MAEFDLSKIITPQDVAAAVTAGVVAYIRNRARPDKEQQPSQPQPDNTASAAAPDVDPDDLPKFTSWDDVVGTVKQDRGLFNAVARAAHSSPYDVDEEEIWDYAARNKLTVGEVVDLVKKMSSTAGDGRWGLLIRKEPDLLDYVAKSDSIQDAIIEYSNDGNTIDWHMMKEFDLGGEVQETIKANTISAFQKEYSSLPKQLVDSLSNEVEIGYRSVDSLEDVADYALEHPELTDGLSDAIKQSATGSATLIVKCLKMYSKLGEPSLSDKTMKRLMKYSSAFCDLLKQVKPGNTDVNDTEWAFT